MVAAGCSELFLLSRFSETRGMCVQNGGHRPAGVHGACGPVSLLGDLPAPGQSVADASQTPAPDAREVV